MLERILGSTARVSLLRVLLTSEQRDWSINELARRAGISTSTAHKEVKNLLGIVLSQDPLTKKYLVEESQFTQVLGELFRLEAEKLKAGDIFSTLSELGFYYLSGSSAIILRGLSRDFLKAPNSFLFMCDRKISKLRGALLSLFPYKMLFVEEKIEPNDFSEVEVYFEGEIRRTNLAVLEKAVVDAIWKYSWEKDNITHVVYCLLEQPLDFELLVKYAKRKGRSVEGRLQTVLEILSRATGRKYILGNLRPERESREFRRKVEAAVEDVLRS